MDQGKFPKPGPMFEGFFALDGSPNIVKEFVIDKPMKAIAFCKTLNQLFTVLMDTPGQVVGDADIKRPIAFVGHDVNEAAHMPQNNAGWSPRKA
jgi:hypothetical protein